MPRKLGTDLSLLSNLHDNSHEVENPKFFLVRFGLVVLRQGSLRASFKYRDDRGDAIKMNYLRQQSLVIVSLWRDLRKMRFVRA